MCDIIAQELKDKKRISGENDNYLAIAPFASHYPYETHIMPKKHNANFENDQNIKNLALLMQEIIKKMERKLDSEYDPLNYTLCLYTAPNENSFSAEEKQENTFKDDFHWHMIIIPKIGKLSNFEKITGIPTNPVYPEKAAKDLREIKI